MLEPHSIRQRVQREGVFLRALDTKKVDFGAKPQHQVVVRERRHFLELDLPIGEIDVGHAVDMHRQVGVPAQNIAQRMGDFFSGNQVGGNLIEHRLKGVIVVLVDQHHIRVGVLELFGGAESGKAAAEDHNFATVTHCLAPHYQPRTALSEDSGGRPTRSVSTFYWATRIAR